MRYTHTLESKKLSQIGHSRRNRSAIKYEKGGYADEERIMNPFIVESTHL